MADEKTLSDAERKSIVDEAVKAATEAASKAAVEAAQKAVADAAPAKAANAPSGPQTGTYDVKNLAKSGTNGFYDAAGVEYSLKAGATDKGVKLTEDGAAMLERTGFKVTKGK